MILQVLGSNSENDVIGETSYLYKNKEIRKLTYETISTYVMLYLWKILNVFSTVPSNVHVKAGIVSNTKTRYTQSPMTVDQVDTATLRNLVNICICAHNDMSTVGLL